MIIEKQIKMDIQDSIRIGDERFTGVLDLSKGKTIPKCEKGCLRFGVAGVITFELFSADISSGDFTFKGGVDVTHREQFGTLIINGVEMKGKLKPNIWTPITIFGNRGDYVYLQFGLGATGNVTYRINEN